MTQKMGLPSIILLGVNGIIGTGIFLIPGKVMALAGPACLWLYLMVAVFVGLITLCFADCASIFTRNGGPYVYAREAFGELIGFKVGVLKWVASMIAWAAMTTGFITSLGAIWPEAAQEPYRAILITILLSLLGLANLLGANFVKRLNNMITICKLLPLILLIVIGALYVNPDNFVSTSFLDVRLDTLGATTMIIFYAFAGFESLAVAAEEMHNPRKNLPIALVVVLLVVAAIYFSVQVVAMGVLGESLATSITPIIDVTTVLFGPIGTWMVGIASLLSMGGIMVAASFGTPRSGEALATDAVIPMSLAAKNRFGAPYIAVIVTVIITLVVALYGNFLQLAGISVLARATQYIPTSIAVLFLNQNSAERFLRGPLRQVVAVTASLASIWLLFQAPSDQLIGCAIIIGLLFPLYYISRSLSQGKQPVVVADA